ncbi:HAD-IIA family hydrolase [Pseudonocardia spinosispora]|uniref:HAD-IIA family hydrolase n=1 Tax=Pseudonocardia spinosispora TaxID=103441 RepID=UPI0004285D83|nr:HAD-IIA family hydrolase [Pseudonocardia spinosispora]
MTTLLDTRDALLFDLDGTLFRGATAVPGAVSAVASAAERGVRICYLTNNGSRSGAQVVEHLRGLGFPATEPEVVTSGQGAARILADRLPRDSTVLVVGTEALAAEVTGLGLRVVERAEDAAAVVQGHSPKTGWADLAEAALAIRAGALWVACNVDATLPDERGLLPGNGAMVAAVAKATGSVPLVAGKPEVPLFDEAVRRTGARRPLVVGDRLDTDISGANGAGLPSLLVLTGVADAHAVLTTGQENERPTYLAADLGALAEDADLLRPSARSAWQVEKDHAGLTLSWAGDETPDAVAALRALCAVHWAEGGGPVDVRPDGRAAAEVLRSLGLSGDGARPGDAPVG